MRFKRLGVVVAVVATGLVTGVVFGPAIVHASGKSPATTSQVQIKDDTKSYLASVSKDHKLIVDTEADLTNLGASFLDTYGLQYTLPNGQAVLANGNGGCTKSSGDIVVLASVNLNMSSGQGSAVTVTVQGTSSGSNKIAYQTTFASGEVGSHDFSFDGGVFYDGGWSVSVSPSSAGLTCQVIGQDLTTGAHPTLHVSTPRG